MSQKAATLVGQAKEWAAGYGDYSNGPEGAALTAALRVRVAWGENDAQAFADMFTEKGSALFGDEQLHSRDEIREYLRGVFGERYAGTSLVLDPVEIRLLADDVALLVSDGGVARAGAGEVAPGDTSRTMWVLTKRDGDWRVVSYQSSPVAG